MTEFEDKTEGGYEYVILERDGPDGMMFGRIKGYGGEGWVSWSWGKTGKPYPNSKSPTDLIPRITVSDAVVDAAFAAFDGGTCHFTDDRMRAALAPILSRARQEWEAGR